MNPEPNLAPVPVVRIPDEDSHRRRRAGAVLLLVVLATALGCALILGWSWLGGGLRIVDDSAAPVMHSAPTAPTGSAARAVVTTTPPSSTPASTTPTALPTLHPTRTTAPTKVPVTVTHRQLRVLDAFARIVRQRYVYADFNGMNWDQVMRDDTARVRTGIGDEDFYTMLADRIDELGDDHSAFLSPKEATDEDDEYDGSYVYAGVGIVTYPITHTDGLAVLQVFPDSPAAAAGVRPHDRIVRIDDQPAVDADGNSSAYLFRGDAGTHVHAVVRAPDGSERTIDMVRAEVHAAERVEHRIIRTADAAIGYLSIPTLFEESIDEQVRDALKAVQSEGDIDGLILDLRINGGGALDVLQPTLGFFTRGTIGSLYDRSSTSEPITVRAENVGRSQSLPLIVLIGPATESYAEVFAGALHAKGRAVLIGQPTAGNIETLRSHEFEDGSRLWLAEQSFRLPSGKGWEGSGLAPDLPINAQWHEYTTDDDPVIAAALDTFQ